MTRFARAKGSKASNEKLPESATSWSEMKQELLNKTKELTEKKEREAAMKKRDESYRAFLQEKEEEEEKKVQWADFPHAARQNGTKTMNGFKNKLISAKQINESDDESDDETFTALKAQIDQALLSNANQPNGHISDSGSDSDEPPEEAGVKTKPQEIVVKKVKKPKQMLKILSDNNKPDKPNGAKQNNKLASKMVTQMKPVKELSEKEKRLIEKKYERNRKQAEKKKLKRLNKSLKEKNSSNLNADTNIKPQKPASLTEEVTETSEAPVVSGLNKQKLKRLNKSLKEKNSSNLNNDTDIKPQKPASLIEEVTESSDVPLVSDIDKQKLEKKLERRKRQKEKRRIKQQNAINKDPENLSEQDLKRLAKKKAKIARQAEKRKQLKAENAKEVKPSEEALPNSKVDIKPQQNVKKPVNKKIINTEGKPQKKAKMRDNNEHQRRKDKPERMIINGKTVDVDYIDGFPIKKEDADRIRQLRKEMISKGLPRSEIDASLRLERRRAEKAFAREKKKVCFKCRKSGHNLSECPELDRDQVAETSGTGICFKCGSTEHTHFECKVVRGMDYKFASCFICKEQGHIAKQCPDNQRGLYPKGGACKVCGDVTHLKKDCPKYQAQQAQLQNSLSIGTLDNGNPDDFDGVNRQAASGAPRRLNKVVKF